MSLCVRKILVSTSFWQDGMAMDGAAILPLPESHGEYFCILILDTVEDCLTQEGVAEPARAT